MGYAGKAPRGIGINYKGRSEVAKLLLEIKSIDIDSNGNSGRTPLFQAALRGHSEVVKLLLEIEGVIVNYKGQMTQFLATLRGHLKVVKLLFEVGGIEISFDDKNSSPQF
jgi:ankyrin repeat protein